MGVFRLVGVPKIRQQHDMSCWYAAARMVCGTFINGPLFGMGDESSDLFEGGLDNGHYVEFQRQNHMKPLNDNEDELMDNARRHSLDYPGIKFKTLILLLDKYGPLWTVIGFGKHAIVLVGAQTHENDEMILYHNPATGQLEVMSYNLFNERQVDWRCEGILGHYEKMPRAPRISSVVSVSNGLYAIGEIS